MFENMDGKMITQNKTDEILKIVKETNLKHIAVIMDGNRRWAKLNNLPSAFGHKKGVDALKTAMRACDDFGSKILDGVRFFDRKLEQKKRRSGIFDGLAG